MKLPWAKKQPLYWVPTMQIAEPVVLDLVLTRTSLGYDSHWRVDQMSQSSPGAVALAEELAKALPEIMRRASRRVSTRPEVIHLKMGMY